MVAFTVGGMHPPVAVAADYQAVASAELGATTALGLSPRSLAPHSAGTGWSAPAGLRSLRQMANRTRKSPSEQTIAGPLGKSRQ